MPRCYKLSFSDHGWSKYLKWARGQTDFVETALTRWLTESKTPAFEAIVDLPGEFYQVIRFERTAVSKATGQTLLAVS